MSEEPSASSPETPPPRAPRKSVGTGFAGETSGTPNIPPDDATVRMESSSTAQVIGDFEILGKLGQGGMGTVYRARQISLDRQVALKILPATLEADAEFVSRFQREARVAASLSHGNLVKVYAAGEADGCHFIAMELIEGETLGQWLKRGPLPPPEALRICGDVARALEHGWNRAQLIHRDIKPGNIFLSQRGEVKVGDLGLAKTMGGDTTGLTQTGTAMGTPHYISPEQARGESDLDFRADIYSLGCTLYQMLTGRTPYTGSDPVAVFHQHIHGAPPAILKVLPGCPIPLARLVGKMLKKVKRERQATYADLIAEIERAEAIFNPAASALESTLPADPDGTLIATPGNTPATPRSATPVTAPVVPPAAKSKVPLYGGIAAGLAVLIGIIVAVLPKEEKLTAAERYAREHPSTPAPAEPPPATPASSTAASPGAPGRSAAAPLRPWSTAQNVPSEATWENGVLRLNGKSISSSSAQYQQRDAILRASVLMTADNAGGAMLLLRGGRYALAVTGDKQPVLEIRIHDPGTTFRSLGRWPLPRTYQPDEWARLEFRVVGTELTASIDGQVLGTVEDSTVPGPGWMGLRANRTSSFRDIEYVPLDGVAAPAASAGWQPLTSPENWRQNRDGREFSDGLLHISHSGLVVPEPWADGAIRALVVFREGSQGPALVARADETTGFGLHYRFGVGTDGKHLFLGLLSPDKGPQVIFSRHMLPRPVAPGDRLALELRVQGDRLIGLLDGKVVAEARDTRITRAGRWGLTAIDGWFEFAEVQSLPASAPTSTPAEAWQDFLRMPAEKLRLFDGAERTAEGLRIPVNGARASPAVTATDGAMRVRALLAGGKLILAIREDGKVGVYLLVVRSDGTLTVQRMDLVTRTTKDLQTFALGHPIAPGQEITVELRAVGSTLTAKVDGQILGSVTDTALTRGVFNVNGKPTEGGAPIVVKSFEILQLDTPHAAPAEAWQDVLRDPAKLRFFKDAAVTPEGLRLPSEASAAWLSREAGPKRDGAVRMKATFGALRPVLRGKMTPVGCYQLGVGFEGASVKLGIYDERSKQFTALREFPLKAPLAPGHEYLLELRVVGETLTAKLNGEVLGTATDRTYDAGAWGVGSVDTNREPTLVKSLEVLDLDAK